MLYSSNRVNQFYVVKKVVTTGKHLDDSAEVGSILFKKTNEGELYFEYKSPGGIITSDRINPERVMTKSAKDGTNYGRQLDARVIKFKDVANKGNDASGFLNPLPYSGQNLSITLELGGYPGLDELDKRICQGYVYFDSNNMLTSDAYAKLAHSLALNIASMPDPMIRIILLTGDDDSTGKEIEIKNCRVKTKLTDLIDGTSKYKGILIRERVDTIYVPGKGEEVPLTIAVSAPRAEYNETRVDWIDVTKPTLSTTKKVYGIGGVTEATAEYMPNGRRTCDYERWCMGDRGDQERMYSWPNNVDTQYLVDPANVYDYLNVHFYWVGNHEEVQKSERDLVLVTPHYSSVVSGTASGLMKSVVTAINALKVLTIDTTGL